MLFNSIEFVFFFVAIVLIYFLLNHKWRWIWLLVSSYYFYMSWEPSLVFLLLASTLIDYYCGLKMGGIESKKNRRGYMYLSVFVNIGILFFFKYFSFFTIGVEDVVGFFGLDFDKSKLSAGYDIQNIILPIGISFYTFQTLSYTIEIYRGRFEPERNLGKFALYVSYFPQLVAGPIERPGRLLPQFDNQATVDVSRIRKGIIMMAWGFFLKLVVADRLGVYVDRVFANPWGYHGFTPVLASYFFTCQIYYDFAAYTTIALGASKIMGIDLMENFDRPFYSKNLSTFWRKWHISLMTWFRDYLYRPLVIDMKSKRYIALLVVFGVTGLWHGANYTFLIWGLLNGFYLIVETSTRSFRAKFFNKIIPERFAVVDKVLGWIFYFQLIVFSLIFFRSESLGHAKVMLTNIFSGFSIDIDVLHDPLELILMFLLIAVVQIVNYKYGDHRIYNMIQGRKPAVRWSLYLCFIILIVFFSVDRKSAFIYFQF